MIAPARLAAYEVLRAVGSGRADLGSALARQRSRLSDERDRALAGEIATGTLRWQGAYDHVVAAFASRPLKKLDAEVLDILRMTMFQLLQLERIPASAAVKEAVKIPVIVTGRIADMDLAESIVAENKADIVGMVRALIAEQRNWQVRDDCVLALFSFQKFVMYKDLEAHGAAMQRHELVRRLVARDQAALPVLPAEVQALVLDRDFAPEGHDAFRPTDKLIQEILDFESQPESGLNGHLLLLHLGSARKDHFYTQLGTLIDQLQSRGYSMVRIDELLGEDRAGVVR